MVSVLTHRAIPAAEIDAAVALEQLQSVRHRPAKGPEEIRPPASGRPVAELRVSRRAR